MSGGVRPDPLTSGIQSRGSGLRRSRLRLDLDGMPSHLAEVSADVFRLALCDPNVRFGSLADIFRGSDVCFTPKRGHRGPYAGIPETRLLATGF
jgi:hypothetical protein